MGCDFSTLEQFKEQVRVLKSILVDACNIVSQNEYFSGKDAGQLLEGMRNYKEYSEIFEQHYKQYIDGVIPKEIETICQNIQIAKNAEEVRIIRNRICRNILMLEPTEESDRETIHALSRRLVDEVIPFSDIETLKEYDLLFSGDPDVSALKHVDPDLCCRMVLWKQCYMPEQKTERENRIEPQLSCDTEKECSQNEEFHPETFGDICKNTEKDEFIRKAVEKKAYLPAEYRTPEISVDISNKSFDIPSAKEFRNDSEQMPFIPRLIASAIKSNGFLSTLRDTDERKILNANGTENINGTSRRKFEIEKCVRQGYFAKVYSGTTGAFIPTKKSLCLTAKESSAAMLTACCKYTGEAVRSQKENIGKLSEKDERFLAATVLAAKLSDNLVYKHGLNLLEADCRITDGAKLYLLEMPSLSKNDIVNITVAAYAGKDPESVADTIDIFNKTNITEYVIIGAYNKETMYNIMYVLNDEIFERAEGTKLIGYSYEDDELFWDSGRDPFEDDTKEMKTEESDTENNECGNVEENDIPAVPEFGQSNSSQSNKDFNRENFISTMNRLAFPPVENGNPAVYITSAYAESCMDQDEYVIDLCEKIEMASIGRDSVKKLAEDFHQNENDAEDHKLFASAAMITLFNHEVYGFDPGLGSMIHTDIKAAKEVIHVLSRFVSEFGCGMKQFTNIDSDFCDDLQGKADEIRTRFRSTDFNHVKFENRRIFQVKTALYGKNGLLTKMITEVVNDDLSGMEEAKKIIAANFMQSDTPFVPEKISEPEIERYIKPLWGSNAKKEKITAADVPVGIKKSESNLLKNTLKDIVEWITINEKLADITAKREQLQSFTRFRNEVIKGLTQLLSPEEPTYGSAYLANAAGRILSCLGGSVPEWPIGFIQTGYVHVKNDSICEICTDDLPEMIVRHAETPYRTPENHIADFLSGKSDNINNAELLILQTSCADDKEALLKQLSECFAAARESGRISVANAVNLIKCSAFCEKIGSDEANELIKKLHKAFDESEANRDFDSLKRMIRGITDSVSISGSDAFIPDGNDLVCFDSNYKKYAGLFENMQGEKSPLALAFPKSTEDESEIADFLSILTEEKPTDLKFTNGVCGSTLCKSPTKKYCFVSEPENITADWIKNQNINIVVITESVPMKDLCSLTRSLIKADCRCIIVTKAHIAFAEEHKKDACAMQFISSLNPQYVSYYDTPVDRIKRTGLFAEAECSAILDRYAEKSSFTDDMIKRISDEIWKFNKNTGKLTISLTKTNITDFA